MNNDWFDIKLLILFSWNWFLDNDNEFSESCQVLPDLKKRLIKEEKKMISEIEMMKSKNEIKHEVEYQDWFNLSFLTFRRREWINIMREDNENVNRSFHRL